MNALPSEIDEILESLDLIQEQADGVTELDPFGMATKEMLRDRLRSIAQDIEKVKEDVFELAFLIDR